MKATGLPLISNLFMTFAGYAHSKHRKAPPIAAIPVSRLMTRRGA